MEMSWLLYYEIIQLVKEILRAVKAHGHKRTEMLFCFFLFFLSKPWIELLLQQTAVVLSCFENCINACAANGAFRPPKLKDEH